MFWERCWTDLGAGKFDEKVPSEIMHPLFALTPISAPPAKGVFSSDQRFSSDPTIFLLSGSAEGYFGWLFPFSWGEGGGG